MAERFGDHLTQLLDRRGLTQAAFARRVGKAPGVINFIRVGKRTPPLAQMGRWAEVLELRGEERARFLELAALAHAPEEVHRLVAQLHRRVAALEAELAAAGGRRAAEPRRGYRA